jgi:hypothetical protein
MLKCPMITDIEYWNRWEEDYQRRQPINIARNFALMDGMYQEARQMGLLSPADPLEGLDPIILYAKAINVPNPSLQPR